MEEQRIIHVRTDQEKRLIWINISVCIMMDCQMIRSPLNLRYREGHFTGEWKKIV